MVQYTVPTLFGKPPQDYELFLIFWPLVFYPVADNHSNRSHRTSFTAYLARAMSSHTTPASLGIISKYEENIFESREK